MKEFAANFRYRARWLCDHFEIIRAKSLKEAKAIAKTMLNSTPKHAFLISVLEMK